MMEKSDNNSKRTDSYKFQKGKSGNPKGRPKGAKDKVPQTVKQNIEKTFEKLGGIKGLVEWAKKSNYNMAKIYDWYFSMLPKNVDANIKGELKNIFFMMPRPKKKDAAKSKD